MSTRKCPIPSCRGQMRSDQVVCRTHWFSLPKGLREDIWMEYKAAPGSPEHLEAIHRAIEHIIEKEHVTAR